MSEREKVGALIRSRRQDRGLTLRDVAARAGVSYQLLSQIENGANTTLDRLEDLAAVLDLRFRAVLEPREEPPVNLDLTHVRPDRRAVVQRFADIISGVPRQEVDVLVHLLEIWELRDEP